MRVSVGYEQNIVRRTSDASRPKKLRPGIIRTVLNCQTNGAKFGQWVFPTNNYPQSLTSKICRKSQSVINTVKPYSQIGLSNWQKSGRFAQFLIN